MLSQPLSPPAMINVSDDDDTTSTVTATMLTSADNSGAPWSTIVPLTDYHQGISYNSLQPSMSDSGSFFPPQAPETTEDSVTAALWEGNVVEDVTLHDLPPEIRVRERATPVQDTVRTDASGRLGMDAGIPTSLRPPGRNLVVCIDGTANQFGLKNTHVVELYSRLVKDERQLTYYDSGIGTYVAESNMFVRIKQKIEHIVDMAIAINHKRITLSAYQWLSENYIPGDKIYLFGFSRGAYQVRIISGMIEVVGLLHKGNNNQIAFAYQLYLAMIKVSKGRGQSSTASHTKELCAQFKRTLSHEHFQVHFVGAWDTVSSIGVTRGPSFPETTSGMGHVRAFRHAISLNERRIKFLPEHANGGSGPISGCGNVKEVWFVGSHSDIGGGNDVNLELKHFGPSLRWMLYEAIEHGLHTRPFQGGWNEPNPTSSMSWFWWILEILPLKRLSYDGGSSVSDASVYWPHFAAPRRIQDGQLIHESAITYLSERRVAEPTALIRSEGNWHSLSTVCSTISPSIIERDSHIHMAAEVLRTLRMPQPLFDTATSTIMFLMGSAVGRQSLIDTLADAQGARLIIDALQRTSETSALVNDKDTRKKHANTFASALALLQSTPRGLPVQPAEQAFQWLRFADITLWHPVMRIICGLGVLNGHSGPVYSVAYSPNNNLIVSGSDDSTSRLWDAKTRQSVGALIQGREGWRIGTTLVNRSRILSVAFSPDGRSIVAGMLDCTIRIWDAVTHQGVGSPLVGHTGFVYAVTVSPDGRLIASGSGDNTIRLWNMGTGRAVGEPLHGHVDWVRSVAFSASGKYIASGSSDRTVRIWDMETLEVVWVLKGHSDSIRSVAFFPDSSRVVSGSYDGTVRVWSGGMESVLRAHHGQAGGLAVNAVAVSSDGKYIASGSDDHTVRLWYAQTGEAVGRPLIGHTESVSSVAFSSDSRHVVSGSFDGSLIIWDVE